MQSTRTPDPARRKAALAHLVASIAVVGGILAVPRFLWYPGALWPLSGIDRHLLLLFAAVLAVGPALTWLVYRSSKRTLRMDLAVVVLVQLLFLGYATAMLARLRPVYLVGMASHMELVRALDIDPADLALAPEERQRLPWTGPVLVGALPPGGAALFGNDDHARRPVYYFDYSKIGPALAQRGQPADGNGGADARMVPLISQAGRAGIRLDARDGRPLQAVPVDK